MARVSEVIEMYNWTLIATCSAALNTSPAFDRRSLLSYFLPLQERQGNTPVCSHGGFGMFSGISAHDSFAN
ncbi:MAG: hypothetical protein ACYCWN_13745 [Ferrimicrobium sp.]|uniref:Uncharacterized protein n=1 Tax=Ferrimicrobium acidiphilum TaxID=121039 RepID=A0ABV3Y1C2_9ACTN|nr:hypothetical protein [Ferrimicrobium sp.]MCL5974136.1 hypothetical protein [Actinomycetota bacterium]